MTFEKLAEIVAADFNSYLEEHNYKSFREFMGAEWLEWEDVKAEIQVIINKASNEAYNKGEFSNFYMYDDYSYIVIGWDAMSWRDFKKLIFSIVKY